jgi:uncharacterized UBP type Zn finger protein
MSMLIQTYKLFRVMWSGKWAGVSPTQFFKSVMDHMQKFRGYRQQDAHEFVRLVLTFISFFFMTFYSVHQLFGADGD